MNDRQDPYDPYAQDPYGQEPQIYGYDAYGRPVYQPQAAQQQSYDPYAQQQAQQQYGEQQQQDGYGYDPYAQPQHHQPQQHQQQHTQTQSYDPYAQQEQHQHQQQQYQQQPQQYHQHQQQQQPQGYGHGYPPAAAPATVPPQREANPYEELSPEQLRGGPEAPQAEEPRSAGPRSAQPKRPGGPGGPGDSDDEEYHTEQFSFVEEEDEESDDVIDWLKFAETRSERRDERRRKGRNRVIALVVVLAIAAAGGVGYLWYAGKLPGLSGSDDQAAAGGPQKRDVIVVHLRETKGGGTSTALLVDNETAKKGTTVLLPNSLSVSTEDGASTTLGKSVSDEGSDSTRDSLSTLLGSKIQGTWRLDTPYLENLVELVGGITLDTDATVPSPQKGEDPLAKQGKDQILSGQAAVAYATYRAPGEAQSKQLARFGQVMQAALKKVSSDTKGATSTVESLAQIPDPSLSEQQLGASLARLAGQAKSGAYDTAMLPVQADGTLSSQATDHVVKDILGGTVKNTDKNTAPRVSVTNAGGPKDGSGAARVALVNGGFTVVTATEGGGAPQSASRVTYADAAQAGQAKEVAKTLGLPETAVRKGKGAANADITVLLGSDYDAEG
ncbi:LytR C-terminal domain-containing protein [Streptomyces sp. 4503]|uniref:LytR C-terminal domain-containing protein n=1 Tax=Streptomyces niphimycinicus TaxID=2842201 RepID=A0ABS6CJT0_9ACTN|nr:LCP family protein [Streptomyces niphimycinicus]MBU3867170.1 LytR C-terminal domain-containing protein [Streptomyces niphimycinicus]